MCKPPILFGIVEEDITLFSSGFYLKSYKRFINNYKISNLSIIKACYSCRLPSLN